MKKGIHIHSVGKNKGKLRIWSEGFSLSEANFAPGTPIYIEYGEEIVIRTSGEGDPDMHISSRKRGKKSEDGKTEQKLVPILDLTNKVDQYFSYKEKVRLEIRDGEIRITKVASFCVIEENEAAEVSIGEKFTIVELPSGAGFGGYAFEQTGLYEVVAAADLDDKALEALRHNQSKPQLYWANMFDLHQDDLPSADVFMFTPDCTSYSLLGRRDFVCSASAPMVHHGLRIISAKRFPVVLLENVVEFGKSIWYRHYVRVMELMGYNIVEKTLEAWDFGTVATRPRFISVATQKPFEFEFPEPKLNKGRRDKVKAFVTEIEERKWLSISDSKTLQYFFGAHKATHKERGNGFGITENALISLDAIKMPAFVATYHKMQANGPYLRHPKDEDKLSMFTPEEILRIQGFPDYEMPEWHSSITRYKLIGQAICGRMFRSLAVSIATTLMQMKLATKAPSFA